MEILNGSRGVKLKLFLLAWLLCAQSIVWASGADVTVNSVLKFDGKTTVTKSWIKLTYGGTAVFDAVKDFSGGNFGYGPGLGDDIGVLATAWDTEVPATAADKTKHYGYLSGTTSGPSDNARPISGSIIAKYRADMPFPPEITTVVEAKTTNVKTKAVTGTLTISGGQQLPGTGEDAEISDYLWKYWKGTDTPKDVSTDGGLNVSDAVGPNTYYFQLALKNKWGTTAYCTAVPYTFGGSGDAGGMASLNADFVRPSEQLGINTFALPFDPAKATKENGTAVDVTTPRSLIKEINTQSGGKIVTVFGWYDKTLQKSIGVTGITYDEAGNIASSTAVGYGTPANVLDDTKIQKNLPYQISINAASGKLYLKGSQ